MRLRLGLGLGLKLRLGWYVDRDPPKWVRRILCSSCSDSSPCGVSVRVRVRVWVRVEVGVRVRTSRVPVQFLQRELTCVRVRVGDRVGVSVRVSKDTGWSQQDRSQLFQRTLHFTASVTYHSTSLSYQTCTMASS